MTAKNNIEKIDGLSARVKCPYCETINNIVDTGVESSVLCSKCRSDFIASPIYKKPKALPVCLPSDNIS